MYLDVASACNGHLHRRSLSSYRCSYSNSIFFEFLLDTLFNCFCFLSFKFNHRRRRRCSIVRLRRSCKDLKPICFILFSISFLFPSSDSSSSSSTSSSSVLHKCCLVFSSRCQSVWKVMPMLWTFSFNGQNHLLSVHACKATITKTKKKKFSNKRIANEWMTKKKKTEKCK